MILFGLNENAPAVFGKNAMIKIPINKLWQILWGV
jgi:hypothetical protein